VFCESELDIKGDDIITVQLVFHLFYTYIYYCYVKRKNNGGIKKAPSVLHLKWLLQLTSKIETKIKFTHIRCNQLDYFERREQNFLYIN